MEYKYRRDNSKIIYPIRENEKIGKFSRRIKKKLYIYPYPEYYEKFRKEIPGYSWNDSCTEQSDTPKEYLL